MSSSDLVSSLPVEWTTPQTTARMHILVAHAAARAVVIRRKPSKWVHVINWDTKRDELEHGSWFRGRIYAERCDLSWDGRWMVYLAMGSNGRTWNGICEPPRLRTLVDVPNVGTWAGGGYFSAKRTLQANDVWHSGRSLSEFSRAGNVPFAIERMDSGGEAFPILGLRLERDGWQRAGQFGRSEPITLKHSSYSNLCVDDPGWWCQPTPKHPVLRMFYRGYLVGGYTFEFQLDGSDLLGPAVDWATWDAKGDLLVARGGAVERYTLNALKKGVPSFRMDFEDLAPPRPAGNGGEHGKVEGGGA